MKITKDQLMKIIQEELAKALSEGNWWERSPVKPKEEPKKDLFARPRRKEEPKKDLFNRSRSGAGEWWGNDDHEPQDLQTAALKQGLTGEPNYKKHFGPVPERLPPKSELGGGIRHGDSDFNEKVAYIRKGVGSKEGTIQYFVWTYDYGAPTGD